MPAVDATVIATYSRRMRLRTADGSEVDARIKGKKLRPVCGDHVEAASLPDEPDWIITAIQPRRNALDRPNSRGQTEVLAANIDLLVVVAAATPKPDWFIVDRYLCAAELMPAKAAVVFNKTDLAEPDDSAILDVYRKLGYATFATSAIDGSGIDSLAQLLRQQTALIVGQSGVGKSSIINYLSDISKQKTGSVSDKSGEGKHTTVNSAMLPLRGGGHIIDSPGVRDYAPALNSQQDAANGYREVRAAAEHCRFANCKHLREPGCAVKAAVENGEIDERRYESYRRTVFLAERLSVKRY
tara:strand:- start:3985 stop:4881 length:897 start_codon:yes stop_codon:yes gene_type:complete